MIALLPCPQRGHLDGQRNVLNEIQQLRWRMRFGGYPHAWCLSENDAHSAPDLPCRPLVIFFQEFHKFLGSSFCTPTRHPGHLQPQTLSEIYINMRVLFFWLYYGYIKEFNRLPRAPILCFHSCFGLGFSAAQSCHSKNSEYSWTGFGVGQGLEKRNKRAAWIKYLPCVHHHVVVGAPCSASVSIMVWSDLGHISIIATFICSIFANQFVATQTSKSFFLIFHVHPPRPNQFTTPTSKQKVIFFVTPSVRSEIGIKLIHCNLDLEGRSKGHRQPAWRSAWRSSWAANWSGA